MPSSRVRSHSPVPAPRVAVRVIPQRSQLLASGYAIRTYCRWGKRGRTIATMRVALVVVAAVVLSAAGTGGASTPRKGCRPAETTALVTRFLSAFNRGDRPVLNNQLWGGKLYFNWYAVTADPGSRVDAQARRRDTLMNYFAARHSAGERLTLTNLKLNGVTRGGYRNFEFRLLRTANDQPGGQVLYAGKGASSCLTGRLTRGLWESRDARHVPPRLRVHCGTSAVQGEYGPSGLLVTRTVKESFARPTVPVTRQQPIVGYVRPAGSHVPGL